jgi:hypothetical protein
MDVQAPQRVASWAAVAVALALSTGAAPGLLRAQDGPPRATALPQLEWRIDGTAANANAFHSGLGLNIRSGWYLRTGLALTAGAAQGADDEWRSSYRLDLTSRFLLDPFGERRRGLYAGGGVTVRRDDVANPTAHLLVLVGVEGSPQRRVIPSLELGLGGGVRLGFVLRSRRDGGPR